MQIIGMTGNLYRVLASEDELAIAAGYTCAMSRGWQRKRPANGRHSMLMDGAEIKASEASVYHARILAIRDELRKAAKTLNPENIAELANKIDAALDSNAVKDIFDMRFPDDE